MTFDRNLDSDLWNGERSIGMFVHRTKTYWVIDYKYNFTLDAEADYKAYLAKGHITEEQFLTACKTFRGGVLKLSSDNFLQYLRLDSVIQASPNELKNYFLLGFSAGERGVLYRKVENCLIYGTELDSDDFKRANEIVSKLPLFYINFDRKIYMHMDWDRCHESLVPKDWSAKVRDFSFFILDDDVYWEIDNLNFWRFKCLSLV